MDTDFRKYFRAGIVHFMAFPDAADKKSLIETIKKIACDDYFEIIEITFMEDAGTRNQVRNLLESACIEAYFGAQPVLLGENLNLNDEDQSVREKSIEMIKKCIDQAYEIGAKGLSFLSGRYRQGKKQYAFDLLVDSTTSICEYARKKGLVIELEIFDYDVDKKCLIGPAFLAADFATAIRKNFDNFGLLVDLSHLPLVKESAAETIGRLKEFITHIHIGNCFISDKNSSLYGDKHVPFGTPGSENNVEQLAEFLQALLNAGIFDRESRLVVSFEVKPLKGQDPEAVIAGSKRVLNQAWLMVRQS